MNSEIANIFEELAEIKIDFFCESAWLEHGPFMYWLTRKLKPEVFVELGTQYGFSYFAACQAIHDHKLPTKAFAIDTWQGDHQAGLYGDERFSEVYERNLGFDKFSKLLRSRFNEAAPKFQVNSIDLLHIDGLHTYQAVLEDFETWSPKLTQSGIVLFHDIHVYRDDFGVYKLWEQLKERYQTFEFLHEHGLGILKYGSKETEVDFLFSPALSEQDIDLIRFAFSAAGSRQAIQSKLDQKDEIILKYYRQYMESDERSRTLSKEVDHLSRVVKELKSSLSWKVTKPLRKLNSKVKR